MSGSPVTVSFTRINGRVGGVVGGGVVGGGVVGSGVVVGGVVGGGVVAVIGKSTH